MSVMQEIKDEQTLCFAAKTGNYQALAELLQSDVAKHFNLQSQSSMTPLQFAAARGHLQCVKLLIDYGAELNAINESGLTALHLAAKMNHYQCLKVLLEAGADFSLLVCASSKYRLGTHDVGATALHLAVTYCSSECIEELLQCGADYDAVDAKGRTSLYIAAEAGCEKCFLTLLRYIQGVTSISLPSFDTSDIPLHHAVKNRMVESVKELVHLGADVNHINHKGLSPLHLLLLTRTERKHKSDMEILKYLVLDSHNIDINKRTTHGGKTALQFALDDRDLEVLKILITYGADVNIELCSYLFSPLEFLRIDSSGVHILMYLVNSMPQLRHLESFNAHSAEIILHQLSLALPEEELRNLLGLPLTVTDQNKVDNMPLMPECKCAHLFSFSNGEIPPNPLQQPLLGKIYDHVTQKLQHMKKNHMRGNVDCDYLCLSHIKKMLWYQRLASNPLSLKHCCRFAIRKRMGPSNLKHISKLPLPESLKSYLLLKQY